MGNPLQPSDLSGEEPKWGEVVAASQGCHEVGGPGGARNRIPLPWTQQRCLV
jgi:hypothetical protein